MAEFIYYTVVPQKLKLLLSKLRETGVPKRATNDWLVSLGFKSTNDRTMLRVLEFLGFVDKDRTPTRRWLDFRSSDHRKVLAKAIREGYARLFEVYPDAWQRSQSEIEDVFSTGSPAGKAVIEKSVSTFRSLVELAEFSPATPQVEPTTVSGPLAVPGKASMCSEAEMPSIHINIQVHIDAGASADQIDQVFASMAKHLYSGR